MYNIRLGYGCGIKATLLTASGEVCDLRKARYKGALLVLPNGSTIPCADVSVDDVTNAMYVRLLGDRELTTVGKYGILFNVKMANGVMYSSPVVMFGEVQEDAQMEFKELNISIAVTVTYLPSNVAYTGASPKISPNGTWLVYNDEINAYEDTGEPANYAGILGDIAGLREELTTEKITDKVVVDWRTVGKNAQGEICVLGGDTEVADFLDGYLKHNGYVQTEDLDDYATRKWVEERQYITKKDIPLKVGAFVNDKGYITIEALATLAKKATTLAGYGITNAYTKEEVEAAFFKYTKIDNVTIKRNEDGFLYVASGGGVADSVLWEDVVGKPTWIGSAKPSYNYSEITGTPDLSKYAKQSSLDDLGARFENFLSGSDTDTIINKWSELETFLAGLAETDDLATILSGKANKATTLAGYGITDAYTKAMADDTFVSLNNEQIISARHDFIDGLKIGGLSLYKSQADTVYLDANLVVRGGVTAYGTNETITASLFEALPIDGETIKRDPVTNELYVDASVIGGGGIDETQLEAYLTANAYATQSWVMSQKYITSSALNGYATENWVLSQKYLTGISSSMITDALGYAPLSTGGGKISGDISLNPGVRIVSPSGNIAGTRKFGDDTTNYRTIIGTATLNTLLIGNDTLRFWKGSDSKEYTIFDSSMQSISIPQVITTSIGSWQSAGFRVSGSGMDVAFGANNSSSSAYIWLATKHALRFATNNAERMRISDTGYVGIGTNNPTAKFHTVGKGVFEDILSGSVWVSDGGQVRINCSDTAYWLGLGMSEEGWAIIQGGERGIGARPILLNPKGGYVGIGMGTNPPSEKLDVAGNIKATSVILDSLNFNAGSGNRKFSIEKDGDFVFTTPSEGGWATSYYVKSRGGTLLNTIIGAYGSIDTHTYTYIGGKYDSPQIVILNDGKVGIGTMSPTEKLVVNGNILATGGITARYTSDMRLKQNRRSFKASEVLMSLGAVQKFEYIPSEVAKNKIYQGTHIGLIYQNVVGTALNRMCYEREDGYGSLNYLEPSFISLLAGVGQEHEVRIQQLERENKTFKEENKVLRKEIEYLKQRVA